MTKLCFISIFVFLSVLPVSGQYYNSGQDRGSIKWKKIKAGNISLIYPSYADSVARSFAGDLLWARKNVTSDMHRKPSKINVLMHTEASNSNGMVVWAPKRMEVFSVFPQNNYAQDWYGQLALHEYRHVVQMDKLNQGFTKILGYLLGQQATGAVTGLYLPLWFMEGDAVWSETQYSLAGRGRVNYFSDRLRTQVLEKKIYSFDKATMGSYKDFIPNRYELGFNLVNEVRRDFGDSVWPNVIDYVARNPYMIVPFSHALKLNTGFNKKHLYDLEINKLKREWELEEKSYSAQEQSFFKTAKNKFHSNYRFVSYINDSTLFALKTGMDIIPRFISLNVADGKEKTIFIPGNSDFYNCSFADSTICWAEWRYDPRWDHRAYHVLMTYDMRTHKRKQLGEKTQLFAPQLDRHGDKIVCVENTFDDKFYLTIVDAHSGKTLKKFRSFDFPKMPVWNEDGSKIYFIALARNKGDYAASLDVSSGKIDTLTKPDFFAKYRLAYRDSFLYFESEYNNVLNIYALRLYDGKIFSVTDAPHSITDFNFDADGNLLYSYLTADGLKPAFLSKRNFQMKAFIPGAIYNKVLFRSSLAEKHKTMQNDSFPRVDFKAEKYSKAAHLFNPHSWSPFYIDVNTFKIHPGVTFFSQNILGTSELIGSYEYVSFSATKKLSLKYSYKGFFTVLSAAYENQRGYGYKSDSSGYFNYFKENYFYLEASQPLNLSAGKYYNFLQPSVSFGYRANSFYEGKLLKSMHYRLYGYWLRKKSYRDIYPRFGQVYDVNYYHTPFSGFELGKMFSLSVKTYLPGIAKHHSLRIYAAVEKKNPAEYAYNNVIAFPRGYYDLIAEKCISLKADYLLPLLYPDLSIGSLFYIKRIKSNLFYDYAAGSISGPASQYTSYGIDLSFDMHILRFVAPFDIGLRTIYLENYKDFSFELLFNVNFNAF